MDISDYFRGAEVDQETGEVDGPGWYGLIRGAVNAENGPDGFSELSEDDRESLAECAGLIISEDSQGFVDARIIDDPAELESEWERIESEVSEFDDDDESDESEDEPADGDYTITPCGSLGGKSGVGVVGGKFLGEFDDDESALVFIRERMDTEKFWPNIWMVSDHGNWHLHSA